MLALIKLNKIFVLSSIGVRIILAIIKIFLPIPFRNYCKPIYCWPFTSKYLNSLPLHRPVNSKKREKSCW